MNKYQIIDGNSLGYAAHYGSKLVHDGQQTQAIYGFVRSLAELRRTDPKAIQIVLWDGRASWRFDLLPEYKSNRHSDDPEKEANREAYKAQAKIIREMLRALGVRQMLCSTHEADDMAGLLVSKKKPEDMYTLITGDQDWLQLVRNNVVWMNCRTKDQVGLWNFKHYTGYRDPIMFLEAKCIKGDSSDAISGVGGIGEKRAVEFFEKFGSVENFWNGVDSGVISPVKGAFKNIVSQAGRDIYKRNYQLMQLQNVAPIDRANLKMSDRTERNLDKFIELSGELGFASFLVNPHSIFDLF